MLGVLNSSDSTRTMKLGVNLSGCTLVKDLLEQNQIQNSELIQYQLDGPSGPTKSGGEVADHVVTLAKECNVVSIEGPLHAYDIPSARLLREVSMLQYVSIVGD